MQPPQNNPYGSAYGDNQAPVPHYGVPTAPGQPGALQAAPQQPHPYGAGQQAYPYGAMQQPYPHSAGQQPYPYGAWQQPLLGPYMSVPEHYAADYQASFGTAVKRFFQRGLTFKGYASRREFWLAQLAIIIMEAVLISLMSTISILAGGSGSGEQGGAALALSGMMSIVYMLFSLVVVVPSIAVDVRRLHDAGYPGLMSLLIFVPAGGLVLLVLALQPTRPERWRAEWHM